MISWLSDRQNAPEGGFSGRTNKLVDSCYSHWVGGCWDFVEEALRSNDNPPLPVDIWNKEGIIRYILYAAQNETGGMRDKPYKYIIFPLLPMQLIERVDALTAIIPVIL